MIAIILTATISVLLLVIAGVAKSINDLCTFKIESSIFHNHKFFKSPFETWKNKYKHNNKFLRFLFSTILVSFTDSWHLMNLVKNFSILLSGILIGMLDLQIWVKLLLAIPAYYIFVGSFHIFYTYIFKK